MCTTRKLGLCLHNALHVSPPTLIEIAAEQGACTRAPCRVARCTLCKTLSTGVCKDEGLYGTVRHLFFAAFRRVFVSQHTSHLSSSRPLSPLPALSPEAPPQASSGEVVRVEDCCSSAWYQTSMFVWVRFGEGNNIPMDAKLINVHE